jgi:two-component system OmpR family sensor kinase
LPSSDEPTDTALVAAIALGAALVAGVLAWSWIQARTLRTLVKRLGQEVADLQAERRESAVRVASIEHRMRTPVSMILGWSQILSADPGLRREHAAMVQRIDRAAQALRSTVDILLRASRTRALLESGGLEPVDVDELVRRICMDMAPLVAGRSVMIDCDGEGVALGRADALDTIVTHLVDNALKHGGPHAQVAIRIASTSDHCEVAVEDDGPGFPQGIDLGMPFERGPGAANGGYGLGLHLVRELVSAMGGSLVLGTRDGGGARATVVLQRSSRAGAMGGWTLAGRPSSS